MKPIDRPQELKRYYQDRDVAEDYMRLRTSQPLNGVLHRRQVQFLNQQLAARTPGAVLEIASQAACDLARRCVREYPAGDAMSDALERLAWCESRRGARDAERRLLERLVTEFPRTPAAERAGTRLATISGRTGDTPDGPGRSGP